MTEATETVVDENEQIAQRKQKLADLRTQGNAYPNDFHRTELAQDILDKYNSQSKEELENNTITVSIAGRIVLRRVMGKASFCHAQDMTGKIQIYLKGDNLAEGQYDIFKTSDLGDIIGVSGVLFKTKTGELSIRATEFRLLTKSLRPFPDKFHGLSDQETRYRQRYIDLMVNEQTRKVFTTRSKIITVIRDFLINKNFLEVETPMMQQIPGGATAKPFVTHHNALDMQLYLRVAPELNLKRLVVGGFERVFEINRNFRNEGLSSRHNPEFTMLEFYQAYANYEELMDLTEELFKLLAKEILESDNLEYQGQSYDLSKPFSRMTVCEAICKFDKNIDKSDLVDLTKIRQLADKLNLPIPAKAGLGKLQFEIFEAVAEPNLMEPTFVMAHPAEVSPLARRNESNPEITDRFELYIGGREIANGFSELNDPEDQANRFKQQVESKDAGDEEAMHYDSDYITALEYGMPPTAGEGIGIDRLVMLFTDQPSIRDVLLFPYMRPEG